jgi:hypothetical protein
VKVHGNLVEVSPNFGNGIGIIHQDRGAGAHGPWRAIRNDVHDNTIVHLGSHGRNGIVIDADDDWFWSDADNRFDRNTYVVPDRTVEHWTSIDRNVAWQEVAELGLETNGKLIVEQRAPMELSCDR